MLSEELCNNGVFKEPKELSVNEVNGYGLSDFGLVTDSMVGDVLHKKGMTQSMT